jgi:Na+/melibiose symporter-like transporter
VAQLGGGPVWLRVIYRLGKNRTWAVAAGGSAVLLPLLALVRPGPAAVVPILVVSALRGFASATDVTIPSALFGDVIDYDLWKTGVNRAGNYYAFLSLVTKGAAALGGSLAFFLLGAFGYQVNAVNPASGRAGMLWTALILPSLLLAGSAGMLWRFPIDARRHAIIRKRIEQRAARREPAPTVHAGILEAR